MTNSPIRTVAMLKNEIEKTKQTLVQTDETIKRITGRDGVENRPIRSHNDNFDRRQSRDQRFEGRSALGLNRKRQNSSSQMGLGRRTSRIYDEVEDHFERSNQMSVASSVVATGGVTKCREDIIERQHLDKEGNARNKRMFGLLMGTLQSFKAEGGKNERQQKKRREIERRVEEREKEEKERARKERMNLFSSKKENQVKLRRLQLKMDVVQLHEEWEEQSKQLTNFIRTDTKPNIYYLPKVHTKSSLEKLDKSKKLIEAVVAKRRKLLDEELKNILEGKKDDEEEEDDDAPPKKQTKKQTIEKEENDAESENEIDKNIREDFQISAATDVVVGSGECGGGDGEKGGGDIDGEKGVDSDGMKKMEVGADGVLGKDGDGDNEVSDEKVVKLKKIEDEEIDDDTNVKEEEDDDDNDDVINMKKEEKTQVDDTNRSNNDDDDDDDDESDDDDADNKYDIDDIKVDDNDKVDNDNDTSVEN